MTTASKNNLHNVLKKITDMSQGREKVSVDDVLGAIGRRSFGPLLVILGVLLAVPGVGDIPGVPLTSGSIILLTVGQQFIGRTYIWLPNWILERSVKQKYVLNTISYINKPARFIDSFTSERLAWLVDKKASRYLSSFACLTIALTTPVMEVVFLTANVAGVCLLLFGLAYIARDGIIMLASYLLYFALASLLIWGLFW